MVLINLRGKVVSDKAQALHLVLHAEGEVGDELELHLAGERGRLREVDEVLEREGRRHGLHDADDRLALVVRAPALLDGDVPVADVAGGAEADLVLDHSEGHRVPDHAEIAADALELARGHVNSGLVVLSRDTKLILVDLHKLQCELRNSVLIYNNNNN